ncbi:MAG: hypothetical protein AVDCRST_MAG19-2592, partial [uncultured Thermomicrobiales bacterium]
DGPAQRPGIVGHRPVGHCRHSDVQRAGEPGVGRRRRAGARRSVPGDRRRRRLAGRDGRARRRAGFGPPWPGGCAPPVAEAGHWAGLRRWVPGRVGAGGGGCWAGGADGRRPLARPGGLAAPRRRGGGRMRPRPRLALRAGGWHRRLAPRPQAAEPARRALCAGGPRSSDRGPDGRLQGVAAGGVSVARPGRGAGRRLRLPDRDDLSGIALRRAGGGVADRFCRPGGGRLEAVAADRAGGRGRGLAAAVRGAEVGQGCRWPRQGGRL